MPKIYGRVPIAKNYLMHTKMTSSILPAKPVGNVRTRVLNLLDRDSIETYKVLKYLKSNQE